ncbi:MAG: hypothetical protein QOG66_1329 [Methylobacteriaceae bacterium]|nr:hypothetical protein [Methylobacteriaceae bacterium]
MTARCGRRKRSRRRGREAPIRLSDMAEHHGKGRFSTFVEWLSSVETQRLIALVRMTAIGAKVPPSL